MNKAIEYLKDIHDFAVQHFSVRRNNFKQYLFKCKTMMKRKAQEIDR